MANVKITELTAITAPASSDVLAIVDVDADVTKKVTIANLVGSAAPGSFGAPSFGFADDDDTGMYRAAADQLGFATTGAERFRIDDAGNLHISGDSKYLYLSSDDNQWIRADASTDFIQIGTGNSERLRIDSSGNVGIGATSPDSELHISKADTSTKLILERTNSATAKWSLAAGGDSLLFKDEAANSERMRIDSSGRVGIGETDNSVYWSGANRLVVRNSGDAGASIVSGTNGLGTLAFTDTQTTTSEGFVQYDHSANALKFGTSSSEQVRIDSLGRLLVGTSSSTNVGSGVAAYIQTRFSSTNLGISVVRESSNPIIALGRANGTGSEIVAINEAVGEIRFAAADGTDLESRAGSITCSVDTTPGANDMPGRLTFSTTADGASTPTEAMRINRLGNVGIGTSSPSSELQVNGDSDTQIRVVCSSGGSAGIQFGDTGDVVRGGVNFDATGNNLTLRGYNNTERMRIDSSGRVGIGLTSPSAQLDVRLSGNNYTSTSTTFGVRSPNDNGFYVGTHYDGSGAGCNLVARGYSSTMGSFRFNSVNGSYASPTERMRIDTSGNLLIGRSSVGATGNGHSIRGGDSAIFSRNATGETVQVCRNNSTGDLIQFRRNNTVCGEIVNTGSTSVAYNTSSDYRLKENVVAIADGIERIKELKPSRFNFIAEPGKTVDGFLAHEAQTVVPECATGVKDWVDEEGNPKMQGIDQSKLVPLLTAALQEAIAKIETLETKVAALEAG